MAKNYAENLLFQFDSPGAADHFFTWFHESGEQHYWDWMSEREQEEDGDITGLRFTKLKNGTVAVQCGRFSGPPDFVVEDEE